ncbi:hypothetical protein OVY01_20100 [Robbsia sp. Bb-Pol-6]|uniref:Uncharacterized protein n=1 Tax=Robbsia betulipollinis TaxID=2981849 RepID=A0ABT3ZSN1_9BURK|nr:hypothetical protein [Robbsia betulipollinis]MCY0389452.1 hypothetical protein [Robbsia betulipollinis]
MFTCRNQPCRSEWELSDVDIHDEGQGLLFRCPVCGARNKVEQIAAADGTTRYEQSGSPSPTSPPPRRN